MNTRSESRRPFIPTLPDFLSPWLPTGPVERDAAKPEPPKESK